MNETLAAFEAARPKLFGIAYRMLGTVADAEDVLLKMRICALPLQSRRTSIRLRPGS